MMRLLVLVGSFCFLACNNSSEIVPVAQGLGTDVQSFKFRGSFASASFFNQDGCQFTSIYVSAGDQVVKNGPGQPIEMQQAFLFVDLFDVCDGIGKYGSASLEIQPGQFVAPSNQLLSASLDTSGEVCFFGPFSEDTLGCEQVTVSLDWTGVGDLYRGMNRGLYTGPGYKVTYRDNGSYRDAEVTGAVSVPTISANITLESFGYLSASKGGSMTITK